MQPQDQELYPLEFSEPVCWCESTGTYTNPQGQKLELKVRGKNRERLEQYMKTVRVAFVVVPEGENPKVWEEPDEELDYKVKAMIDAEFKKIEIQPELALEIELDVLDTKGIELPYDMHVTIDPDLERGAVDRYKTKEKCKKQKVTLKASVNGVYGVLSGGGISPVTGQADVYDPNPPKDTAKFRGELSGEVKADFYFTVTGLKDNNKYTYSADMKMEPA